MFEVIWVVTTLEHTLHITTMLSVWNTLYFPSGNHKYNGSQYQNSEVMWWFSILWRRAHQSYLDDDDDDNDVHLERRASKGLIFLTIILTKFLSKQYWPISSPLFRSSGLENEINLQQFSWWKYINHSCFAAKFLEWWLKHFNFDVH